MHAIRAIIGEPGTECRASACAKSTVGLLPLAAFLTGSVLLIVGGAGGGAAVVVAGLAFIATGSVLAVASAILHRVGRARRGAALSG